MGEVKVVVQTKDVLKNEVKVAAQEIDVVFKSNVWIDSVVTVNDIAIPVISCDNNTKSGSEIRYTTFARDNVEYGAPTTYSEAEDVELVAKLTIAELTIHKVFKATKKNFLNCSFFHDNNWNRFVY